MKLALLGDDPLALEIVRAITSSPGDQLATATFAGRSEAEVQRIAPGVRITTRWDELLADSSIDGVIVAGAEPEILEAAKQLAAAGKPLWVVPQAAQGSTFFYELSLVRDDTGVLLVPALPPRADALVAAIRDSIARNEIGKLQYLELTRELPGSASQIPLAEIDAAMLHDVDLLRWLGGDYNQVTAIHYGAGESGVATASVTLSGGGNPEAVWNVKRTSRNAVWELKLTGETATIVLARDAAGNFSTNAPLPGPNATSPIPTDRAAAILGHFKRARELPATAREWTDIVRDMEIVEATHRSVRRRRTIDLHFESTSERSLFKTQMTAIGCGVLTFTLLAVVALLISTPLLDVRDRQQVESERARAVLTGEDFEFGAGVISNDGRKHLDEIARKMPADRFNVLIDNADGNEELNESRRKNVVDELKTRGAADAEQRTVVTEIRGRWLAGVLRLARIAVFAPLFLFLALQLLLFLTRPSSN
ncbi:MAG: hypothetical protein AB7O26_20635 [Planctomycetaceae bacterium]